VSRICLASTSLRDEIVACLSTEPSSAAASARSAVTAAHILAGAEHPDGLADVEFWVPTFLHADPTALADTITAMPNLQVIQAQSAGIDGFLGAVPAGVTLCDARGVHGSSTSEWALTAILSVLRDFPRFHTAQLERRWDHTITDELAGKQVLIVGAGDVGQQLARRLLACDAEPLLVGRSPRAGVRAAADLAQLLPEADVVVVVVPLTSQTAGLVDAAFLARMRDDALFVNAARGPVVDTTALLAELQSGRLRAAMDVMTPEPLPSDHPLWSAPNVLITPHVGGSVRGFRRRIGKLVAAQLLRYLNEQPLENVVVGEY